MTPLTLMIEGIMKMWVAILILIPAMTLAQSVDVKGVEGESEGTTTIQIKKTKNTTGTPTLGNEPQWEVTEGTSDIEGEPAAMNKEARQSWRAACDVWKKEFRADNKENKIINMNCGTPTCEGNTGNKVCTSKATYKVKTKLN